MSPGIFTFQLTLPRTKSTSYLNITLIQGKLTMIDISTVGCTFCTPIIRYRSCLLLNLYISITEVDLFHNKTYSVSALELNFPSTNEFTFITLNEFQLQVLFFPLQTPQHFSVSYSSLSSSIVLPLASCPSPFIVKNSVCDCPAGFFFDFGNCTACPLNSYRSTSHSSCIGCPVNRVTLTNSSTSLGDCLCQKDLFQVNGNCINCPSGTDCHYGSITRVRDGLLFTESTLNTTKCTLPYLCRNNSCLSAGFKGTSDHCLSCNEGYRRLFTNCLKVSVTNTLISILSNVVYVVLLFMFRSYFFHIQSFNDNVKDEILREFSTLADFSKKLFEIQSHRFLKPLFCPLLLVFSISLIVFKSATMFITVVSSYLLYIFPFAEFLPFGSLFIHGILVHLIFKFLDRNLYGFQKDLSLVQFLKVISKSIRIIDFIQIFPYLCICAVLYVEFAVWGAPFEFDFWFYFTLIVLLLFFGFSVKFAGQYYSFCSLCCTTLLIFLEVFLSVSLFYGVTAVTFLVLFFVYSRYMRWLSMAICLLFCHRLYLYLEF
ncbi:hypothetical protein GEMRC1_011785 [Eukaryota sp. GEM-RC1]